MAVVVAYGGEMINNVSLFVIVAKKEHSQERDKRGVSGKSNDGRSSVSSKLYPSSFCLFCFFHSVWCVFVLFCYWIILPPLSMCFNNIRKNIEHAIQHKKPTSQAKKTHTHTNTHIRDMTEIMLKRR